MKYNDYLPILVYAISAPLIIAVSVLLPAYLAMIAINCILDIHWPGHHVGYGEAYAISYLAGLIGKTPHPYKDDSKNK